MVMWLDGFLGEGTFFLFKQKTAYEIMPSLVGSEMCIRDSPHTVHADRGTSMTSKPVSALLVDLGVTRSHSRPRVSNDCPLLRSAVQDDEVPLRLPPILRHRPGRANVSVKDSSPSTTTFIAIPGSDGIPLLRSTSAPLAPSTRPARSPSTRPRPRTQNGSPAAQCHHESPSSPGSTNPNQNYRTPDHRTVSLDLTDTDMCRLELCRMRNPLRNDEDRVCARSLALSCLSRS